MLRTDHDGTPPVDFNVADDSTRTLRQERNSNDRIICDISQMIWVASVMVGICPPCGKPTTAKTAA